MNIIKQFTAAIFIFSILVSSSYAGGPLTLNPNDVGNVERWANGGANIPFNPDLGGLGPFINADAVILVETAFQAWQDLPTATATYVNNGLLPFDVNETNFFPFASIITGIPAIADGLSPIIFDEDGAIFETIFGVNSGVLGFASVEVLDANGVPIEGVAFLNGGALQTAEDLLNLQVHEYGHYSGLAHAVVNGESVVLADESGPTPNNTFGPSPINQIETMYPFLITGGVQRSVHRDDQAMFSFLYPTSDFFATSATITGSVISPNGHSPVSGVNVIARNVNNPFVDAITAISGDRGPIGQFTINGLTPGADYVLYIDQIMAGGFSTTPINLPSEEEFYNGANESNIAAIDNPAEFVTLATAAGQTTANINVIFNRPEPNVPLNLGVDGSRQVFLPFDFTLCGNTFDSVFINANGNLTFGQASFDFIESSDGLLTGPPRIAAVWDDLNVTAGGSVTFDQNADEFIVRWDNVPEFPNIGANTFDIVLRNTGNGASDDAGNFFDIRYYSGSAIDGIAGFSCGGGVTSELEPPSDLSTVSQFTEDVSQTAIYEVFNVNNPNDLIAGANLSFLGTEEFEDEFEPNNSFSTSQFVRLPFSSADNERFTEINPAGNDVDYFTFRVKAGTTLIAETTTGQLDSLLGLFDASGNLIAVDDDGGNALLSRIVFVVSESGTFTLATTTFPDFDFVGAGNTFDQARYVLSIRSIKGVPIELGDDDSVEVPLGFIFPYQGLNHSSVFVNSNGNLTFGAADFSPFPSLVDFLNGPARISGLWSDLSPDQGGLVILDTNAVKQELTVTFDAVPEFLSGNSNSFSIKMESDGETEIEYGRIDAQETLVGITEGNTAFDPSAVDLSINDDHSANGTVYEIFDTANDFDLENEELSFE